MAKAGRGAAALATAAHRLVRRRHHRRRCCSPWSPRRWSSWRSCSVRRTISPWWSWPSWRSATVLGSSPLRGLAALCLGLFLGLVGIDLLTRSAAVHVRHPAAARRHRRGRRRGRAVRGRARRSTSPPGCGTAPVEVDELRGPLPDPRGLARSWKPWLRGTAIGFPFGALPAGGAEIPTFLSYATEKRLTKHPEEFGHGAIEGVAGPEAANNAAAAGVLVPLLTLGLPTSATAAILLAAFQSYGIQPGPDAVRPRESDLVWALIASLFIGNVMLLVLNLPLVGIWVKLLRIPRPYLYAGILVFASLGVVRGERRPARPGAAAGHRAAGLRHAPVRLAGGAGGDRADPRPGGRDQPAPGDRHRRGQPGRPVCRRSAWPSTSWRCWSWSCRPCCGGAGRGEEAREEVSVG